MLVCSDNICVFTNHSTLHFTFHPTAVEPFVGEHIILKLINWAMNRSVLSLIDEHVPGYLNTMTDEMK